MLRHRGAALRQRCQAQLWLPDVPVVALLQPGQRLVGGQCGAGPAAARPTAGTNAVSTPAVARERKPRRDAARGSQSWHMGTAPFEVRSTSGRATAKPKIAPHFGTGRCLAWVCGSRATSRSRWTPPPESRLAHPGGRAKPRERDTRPQDRLLNTQGRQVQQGTTGFASHCGA